MYISIYIFIYTFINTCTNIFRDRERDIITKPKNKRDSNLSCIEDYFALLPCRSSNDHKCSNGG